MKKIIIILGCILIFPNIFAQTNIIRDVGYFNDEVWVRDSSLLQIIDANSPAISTGATNGLTKTGDNILLGGTMTETTTVVEGQGNRLFWGLSTSRLGSLANYSSDFIVDASDEVILRANNVAYIWDGLYWINSDTDDTLSTNAYVQELIRVNEATLPLNFDYSIAFSSSDSRPGVGLLKRSPEISNATEFYIDYYDDSSDDQSNFLKLADTGSYFIVYEKPFYENYDIYQITGGYIDAASYVKYKLARISGVGSISSGDEVECILIPNNTTGGGGGGSTDSLYHADTETWLASGDTIPKADSARVSFTADVFYGGYFTGDSVATLKVGSINSTAINARIDTVQFASGSKLHNTPQNDLLLWDSTDTKYTTYPSYQAGGFYEGSGNPVTSTRLNLDRTLVTYNLYGYSDASLLGDAVFEGVYGGATLGIAGVRGLSVTTQGIGVIAENTNGGIPFVTKSTITAEVNSAFIHDSDTILKIAGDKLDGAFYPGISDPTGITRLNYDGHFHAASIYTDTINSSINSDILIESDVKLHRGDKLNLSEEGNSFEIYQNNATQMTISNNSTPIFTINTLGTIIKDKVTSVVGQFDSITFNGVDYISGIDTSGVISANKVITDTLVLAGTELDTVIQLATAIEQTTIKNINYNDTAFTNHVDGRLNYDENAKSLVFQNDISNFNHNLGYETVVRFYNNTGGTLTNGTLITSTGAKVNGSITFTADLAGNGSLDSLQGVAMVTATVLNGEYGIGTLIGQVNGLNTSAYVDNQLLWIGSAGAVIDTSPNAPNYSNLVARVVYADADSGAIYMFPVSETKFSPAPIFSASFVAATETIENPGIDLYAPITNATNDIYTEQRNVGFIFQGDSISPQQAGNYDIFYSYAQLGEAAQVDVYNTGTFIDGVLQFYMPRSISGTNIGGVPYPISRSMNAGEWISFRTANTDSGTRTCVFENATITIRYSE